MMDTKQLDAALAAMPRFGEYAVPGDVIEWERDGFVLRARIEPDHDTNPREYDAPGWCLDTTDTEHGGHNADIIRAWERDEWFYCGVVVTASCCGVDLGVASLWAVECNFPGGDNSYLSESAYYLGIEAVEEARETIAELCEVAA